MSPPGRHQPEADVLRQATDSPQGLSVSGLSPNRDYPGAQVGGTRVSMVRRARKLTGVRDTKARR